MLRTRMQSMCVMALSMVAHQIFYWDSSAFNPSVVQFVTQYAPAGVADYLRSIDGAVAVSYFSYNWDRNGI